MITKEQFDSLYGDGISKKEYDNIISRVDKRFCEICKVFLKMTDKSQGWFDYDNLSYEFEVDGRFDIHEYKEYIGIEGDYINAAPGYDLAFPTRWLWEDFENELKQTSKEYEQKEKTKKQKAAVYRKARKEKILALRASIENKLTPEELKVIKFKA